jgi:hypothetical protein
VAAYDRAEAEKETGGLKATGSSFSIFQSLKTNDQRFSEIVTFWISLPGEVIETVWLLPEVRTLRFAVNSGLMAVA